MRGEATTSYTRMRLPPCRMTASRDITQEVQCTSTTSRERVRATYEYINKANSCTFTAVFTQCTREH